jgi:hypothetical protein
MTSSVSLKHLHYIHHFHCLQTCFEKQNMAAAATSTPPPLVDIPTSKEKRYDRQLRLWAASGQAALEDAHVLLINAGSGVTGIELLKNLVLPGIGQFTIQDSALVSEADLGVNFFLDEDCLGGYRAEHTSRLLQELNPDVRCHAVSESAVANPILGLQAGCTQTLHSHPHQLANITRRAVSHSCIRKGEFDSDSIPAQRWLLFELLTLFTSCIPNCRYTSRSYGNHRSAATEALASLDTFHGKENI